MTTVVLRVQGERLDVNWCLTLIPRAALDAAWRVGERRVGRMADSTTAGFSLVLVEGADNNSVVKEATKVFLSLAPPIGQMVQVGATAEVDFGLMTNGMDGGLQSIKFDASVLRCFEQAGVSIVVSVYPCSD